MKYYSVDRLENGFAVLVDDEKNAYRISLKVLPENIKETDIICKENDRYFIDKDKTVEIKSKLQALQSEIFDKQDQ